MRKQLSALVVMLAASLHSNASQLDGLRVCRDDLPEMWKAHTSVIYQGDLQGLLRNIGKGSGAFQVLEPEGDARFVPVRFERRDTPVCEMVHELALLTQSRAYEQYRLAMTINTKEGWVQVGFPKSETPNVPALPPKGNVTAPGKLR